MARCDRGYYCIDCETDVAEMADSELYLRYIMRDVTFQDLIGLPERHIRCNPELARLIDHPDFDDLRAQAGQTRTDALVTAAFKRLQVVRSLGVGIEDYPLDVEEVRRLRPEVEAGPRRERSPIFD